MRGAWIVRNARAEIVRLAVYVREIAAKCTCTASSARPYRVTIARTRVSRRCGYFLSRESVEDRLELARVVALLIGTGGYAGAQTVSTIIRAQALGEVRVRDVVRVVRREVSDGALIRSVTWNDCILVGVSPGCGYGPRTIRNGDDLGGLHVLDAVGAAIPISSLAATPVRVEPLPWQQETTIVVPAKWLETLLHRTSSRIVQPARSCFES